MEPAAYRFSVRATYARITSRVSGVSHSAYTADSIAAHIFSRREKRAYAAARDKALAFLRCWTRKEALAKGLGAGLAVEPQRLDPAAAPGWRVHTFFPLRGFIAAVACHHG